jgi:tRNA(Ile)-lysidine synthase
MKVLSHESHRRHVQQQVLKFIREKRLLSPGDRLGVAVSGGADSLALLRVLAELRSELGIVLKVLHFNHKIRGADAEADQAFVAALAAHLGLEFYVGVGDVPAYSRERKLSLETAARDLRHEWFAELLSSGKLDKVATAHTLDDQAETVLMRMIRGAGVRGLAGISTLHQEKKLIRPLLAIHRATIEAYLNALSQPWRNDATNLDVAHTRNRVRHQLLPLLASDFNPSIHQRLADIAEVSQAESDYWEKELTTVMARAVRQGKPSRSGRSSSGDAGEVQALDLTCFQTLPLAVQRQVLHKLGLQMGASLEFKHIEELCTFIEIGKPGKRLELPAGLVAVRSFRELQFTLSAAPSEPETYEFRLPVPGEVAVSTLGSTLRARVIIEGDKDLSRYNPALLLDRASLRPELILRNWRAGDQFCPVHTGSPRKIKELLQSSRMGRPLSATERKVWPVIESNGQIVWMRGFPVAREFVYRAGDAVLIEEAVIADVLIEDVLIDEQIKDR